MESILQFFIIVPLVGFAFSLLVPAKKENSISWAAFVTVGLHFAVAVAFVAYWFFLGRPTLNLKEIILYSAGGYEFLIDFYFDNFARLLYMMPAFKM